MKTTEILNTTNNVNAPWGIRFDRDGTEDVAILHDANGEELATSRPFWLPEGDDPIPATLLAMKLMEATPALADILETLIDQIRSLEGESSVIDEDLMQGEAFKEAVALLGSLERYERIQGDRRITVTWSIEDVQEIRPDLNDDQAWEVLQAIEMKHDCNYGITWDTLDYHAEKLFGDAPDTNGEEA